MIFDRVSRAVYEIAVARANAEHENAQQLRHTVSDWAKRHDDLMARYHELRTQGYVIPDIAPQALTAKPQALGPLAQAALADMSIGMPGDVVRAQRAAAEAMAAQKIDDEQIAHALYHGEPLRRVS